MRERIDGMRGCDLWLMSTQETPCKLTKLRCRRGPIAFQNQEHRRSWRTCEADERPFSTARGPELDAGAWLRTEAIESLSATVDGNRQNGIDL